MTEITQLLSDDKTVLSQALTFASSEHKPDPPDYDAPAATSKTSAITRDQQVILW